MLNAHSITFLKKNGFPSTMKLITAPLWRRLVAFIIDLLIMNLVIFSAFSSIFEPLASQSFREALRQETVSPVISVTLLVIGLLALCYMAFFEYMIGQTPGQIITRIEVISTNPHATENKEKTIPLSKAFLRNIFIIPAFPFILLWIVELVHYLFYKHRFLERITATTTVMRVAKSWKEYQLEKVK